MTGQRLRLCVGRERQWRLVHLPTRARARDPHPFRAELTTERELLALIARADRRAIELVWSCGHSLERELAQPLTVFQGERDVVRPDLEHGRRSGRTVRDVAEPGVEEARVVGPELPARRVVGRHLGGVVGRDPDALARDQEVELARTEDQLSARWLDAFPEIADFVGVAEIEIEERGALLGSVPDEGLPGQVDAEEEPVGHDREVARFGRIPG